MITNLSITDMYMSVLSSLSIEEKLDLIAKLTNSIRNPKETKATEDDLFASFSVFSHIIFHVFPQII